MAVCSFFASLFNLFLVKGFCTDEKRRPLSKPISQFQVFWVPLKTWYVKKFCWNLFFLKIFFFLFFLKKEKDVSRGRRGGVT